MKRYCGHLDEVEKPETKKRFLMERGRQCRNCRRRLSDRAPSTENPAPHGEGWAPRPMAMAMDLWNE